jgi:hypothetical protein
MLIQNAKNIRSTLTWFRLLHFSAKKSPYQFPNLIFFAAKSQHPRKYKKIYLTDIKGFNANLSEVNQFIDQISHQWN